MTNAPLDQEHVTLHIRNNPEIFPTVHLIAPPELDWPTLGLTLDAPPDYALLKKIIEHFGTENRVFSCLETINLLKKNPTWLTINNEVTRKGDT
jgi:spore coat polysaccharide biosynthesis protein SpsF